MKALQYLGVATLLLLSTTDGKARYRELSKVQGGTISGRVVLKKAAPSPKKMKVTADNHVCGSHNTVRTHVVGQDKGFGNVVVFLDNVRKGKKLQKQTVTIDQKKCSYVPRVSAFSVGTTVVIKNSDPVFHNTHTYNAGKTVFNIALPNKDMTIPKVIKKPGIVEFKCDAGHTWMLAWAYVTEHPYVTVTDSNGNFTLSDVPAGQYTLKTWHEVEGEKLEQVDVRKSGETSVQIAY